MKFITSIVFGLILVSGLVHAQGIQRDSVKGEVVLNQPIDIDMNIQGVKVESIYFDEKEALVILWNRTPKSKQTGVGLAIYDADDKLMGIGVFKLTDIFNAGSIRAGKQQNAMLSYEKFVNNIEDAKRFELVFSVIPFKKGGPDPDSY